VSDCDRLFDVFGSENRAPGYRLDCVDYVGHRRNVERLGVHPLCLRLVQHVERSWGGGSQFSCVLQGIGIIQVEDAENSSNLAVRGTNLFPPTSFMGWLLWA